MNKTEIKNFLNCKMKDVDALFERFKIRSGRDVCEWNSYNTPYLRICGRTNGIYEYYYINKNSEFFIQEYKCDGRKGRNLIPLKETVVIPVMEDEYSWQHGDFVKESIRVMIEDLPLYEYCENCGVYHRVGSRNTVQINGKEYINKCCAYKGVAEGKYVECHHCEALLTRNKAVEVYNVDTKTYYCREDFNKLSVVLCARDNVFALKTKAFKMYDGSYEHSRIYVNQNCVQLENGLYIPSELAVKVYRSQSDEVFMLKTDVINNADYVLYDGSYYKADLFTEYDGEMVPLFKFKQKIYSYHSWPCKREFKSLEDENTELYFGVEVETCGNEESTLAIGLNRTDDIFHCEHDGSLDYGGYEIISQPMTFNYWMSRKDDVKKTFDKLIALGQKSDETNCCGLHVHVSRKAFKDKDAIRRAVAIVTGFRNNMQIIARRKDGRYYSYQNVNGVITKEKVALEDGHYTAVNCGNNSDQKNTIEFRIFKGTLNTNTFYATLEFVRNIVEVANSDKKRIVFSDLLKGEYLPAYVENRLSKGYHLNVDEILDLQGWNQEEVKQKLESKWNLVKKIKEYNAKNPNARITARTIFGGAC